ncbi:rhodanese/Cell cycle control phosphatase superfamily protein isoform X2 [Wolffia australiana]
MELLAASKLSSALLPRQEQCSASRSPNRSFSSRIQSNFSSNRFRRPKSVANSTNRSFFPQEQSLIIRSEIGNFLKAHVPVSVMSMICFPLASIAAETEQVSSKISVESLLVSLDDFFARYPFVAAGVAVVWLVVIPLAQEYGKKYKYVPAVDAFVKLREDPSCQLIDIRKEQSRYSLNSPNLKSINKESVQIEFTEGQEEEFKKKVQNKLRDPSNTIVCVLDNFDDGSLKVAEMLVKNGFKEAYAIKGGLLGKDGWQAIQGLLPPEVRVYPRKSPSEEVVSSGEGRNDPQVKISGEMNEVGKAKPVQDKRENSLRKKSLVRSSSPYPNVWRFPLVHLFSSQ